MSGLTDVQIINMALDMIPAKGITARTDVSDPARCANRNYDVTLMKCLRRGLTPWNFATKRIQLVANNNPPVNEFSKEFDLPGTLVAIQQFWPKDVPYRKESGKLYTDATSIVLKYTSNDVLQHPEMMEYDFADYFATELAAVMAPKLSEDTARAAQLKKDSEVAFRHASAAFSMEDTPDKIPEGPWIEAHQGIHNYAQRTDWLLDYPSLP